MLEVTTMAYSLDLRKKVMKYREKHSLRKTRETFGISVSTISDWEKLQEENGSLDKRSLKRTFKKIDPVELAEIIVEQPDIYLRELADHFNCTETAVFYALENQNITLKKLKSVIVKQMKKNVKLSKKIWQN